MTTLIFLVLSGAVLVLCIAVAVLRDVAGQRKEERDEARDDRDEAVEKYVVAKARLQQAAADAADDRAQLAAAHQMLTADLHATPTYDQGGGQ